MVMPRIEVKSIKSDQYMIYKNVLNYVAKDDRCIKGFLGATNLLLTQKRSQLNFAISEQVNQARKFYGQEDRRLGIHVIIAFSEEEVKYLNHMKILEIAYHVANTEFSGCMTYFAVHDHTEHLHIDMLVFPLNIHTGRMYGCQREGWNAIEIRLQDYLQKYMPEEAIGGFQVNYSSY